MKNHSLIVSDLDFDNLTSLTASGSSEAMGQLEEKLGKTTVVPLENLPEDVASMHSTVRLLDLDSGLESELTLVFPHEADMSQNKVSILAPMGVALIGLRSGESCQWPMPNGKTRHFIVKAVSRENSPPARRAA
jgi:regulator of nucleoside diphosphate kinase